MAQTKFPKNGTDAGKQGPANPAPANTTEATSIKTNAPQAGSSKANQPSANPAQANSPQAISSPGTPPPVKSPPVNSPPVQGTLLPDISQPTEGAAIVQDYFKKNPTTVMVLIAILLVAVGAVSFYLGRSNGIEQSQTPIAQNGTGPMQAAPGAAGQKLVRLPPKKFENWALACVKTPKNVTRCSLVLRAVSKETKKLLMTLAVSRSGNGKPIMVVVTPPGALLSAGVRMTPGTAKEMTARFIQCGRGACEAAMLLDDAAVTAFSNAPTTNVAFVAGNGKPLGLKLPTSGFAAGYAAWELAMPAPPASANTPAQTPAQEPSSSSPGSSGSDQSTPQNH